MRNDDRIPGWFKAGAVLAVLGGIAFWGVLLWLLMRVVNHVTAGAL